MPATWHGIFNMHMLIEVSRILEGFICTPRGMVVEVRFPPPGLSDGREENQAKKISNEKTRHWLLGKKFKEA